MTKTFDSIHLGTHVKHALEYLMKGYPVKYKFISSDSDGLATIHAVSLQESTDFDFEVTASNRGLTSISVWHEDPFSEAAIYTYYGPDTGWRDEDGELPKALPLKLAIRFLVENAWAHCTDYLAGAWIIEEVATHA